MHNFVIQTTELTKTYKTRKAVDNINLQIEKGDIYGFLGPNGAGKTTTIRMLLGLIKPTKGKIRIFGRDLQSDKLSILRKVGSLVEYPSYYGHLTARENLETVRRIIDVPKSRIDEVLALVRLTNESKRPVKGFSLGMKQRLGIATALLGNPELLILDEPTNGLDPSGILEMRELIKSLPEQYGITVLVSSHLLSEIDQMANKVGIIQNGAMVYQDSIEVLRSQARSGIRIVASNPEQAVRTIASAGCYAKLQTQDNSLMIEQISDDKVALVIEYLVNAGHSVYRAEAIQSSLEDIFLDLIGEGQSL